MANFQIVGGLGGGNAGELPELPSLPVSTVVAGQWIGIPKGTARRYETTLVDPSTGVPLAGLFEGGDALRGPRRLDEAKRLLAESGYRGEPVALCVATDIAITKAQGDVTADMLGKLGMTVDFQALDWGTVGARRAKKDPPSAGGWNIFHTWHAGADCINPAPYTALDAGGDKAWFGWPKSDAVQARIADWYAASDLAAEKAAMAALNRASMENVTFVPTGFFLGYQAWRKGVGGVVKAPFPQFWGVQKT